MAEEAAEHGQQDEPQHQDEAPGDQGEEQDAGGAKKRERAASDDDEPHAKRKITNGDDPPAGGDAEGDDPPAGGATAADGDDCPGPGPAGAAEPLAGSSEPDGGHGGNPGSHGANPGAADAGASDNPGHGPAVAAASPTGTGTGALDDGERTEHPDGNVSEVLHVARSMVGKLIGKGGATIMGLQSSTSASIQVDQQTATRGGECRRVTLKGAPEAVDAAKAQIAAVLASDAPGAAPAAGETSADVRCPPAVVGRIIGRSGETIKLLQAASGAYILVNQNFPEGEDRLVTVSGTPDAVERAANMVRGLISSDQVTVQGVIQKYGLGKTVKMQCPRSAVGRIIGRGGETVKMLQRKYNASVQINQATDPMDVTIIASPPEADACQSEIAHLIAHPDAGPGGGGGPGGGFRGGIPGGVGGMGMGGYGGPRPGYGPGYGAGMPYGMVPPYGMALPGYGGVLPGYAHYGMAGPAPGMMPGYGYGAGGGYDPAAYGAAGAYGAAAQQQAYGGGGGATAGAAPGGSGGSGGASIWQAIADDQGRTYYYNSQTGASQWEKPPGMP